MHLPLNVNWTVNEMFWTLTSIQERCNISSLLFFNITITCHMKWLIWTETSNLSVPSLYSEKLCPIQFSRYCKRKLHVMTWRRLTSIHKICFWCLEILPHLGWLLRLTFTHTWTFFAKYNFSVPMNTWTTEIIKAECRHTGFSLDILENFIGTYCSSNCRSHFCYLIQLKCYNFDKSRLFCFILKLLFYRWTFMLQYYASFIIRKLSSDFLSLKIFITFT